MGEGRRSEGRRRERRRTGRNGSRKGRHGERQKEKKARELRRKGNSDATVRDLLPASRSLSRGWVSFPSAPLTLQSPSSALSPVRAPAAGPLPRPAPAFVSACHLPVNPTKRTWEKHKARAQMCPQTLSHPSPHAGRYSPSQSRCALREAGSGSWLGKPRNYSFLSRLRSAHKTRGLQEGEKAKTTQNHSSPRPSGLPSHSRDTRCARPPEKGARGRQKGADATHTQSQTPGGEKGRKAAGRVPPGGGRGYPRGSSAFHRGKGKSCPPTAELVEQGRQGQKSLSGG